MLNAKFQVKFLTEFFFWKDKIWMKNNYLLKWFMLLWLFPGVLPGQNLVPNSGFEQNTGIPIFLSGWFLVNDWDNAGNAITTPDYYHQGSPSVATGLPSSQFAILNPYADSAIMGMYTFIAAPNGPGYSYREYIQTQLTSPLVPGIAYKVSFAMTNGKTKPPAFGGTDGMGVLFSHVSVSQTSVNPGFNGPISASAQWLSPDVFWDSLWQVVEFTYVATQPFKFLTLGNFRPDSSLKKYHPSGTVAPNFSSYVFVDEISVVPAIGIAGPDTVCQHDTVTLTGSLSGQYAWKRNLNSSLTISTQQNFTFIADTTVTYYLIGNGDTAEHTIRVNARPEVSLGNDTSLCPGEQLDLIPELSHVEYLVWQDGSDVIPYPVNRAGIFSITGANECGMAHDTIQIIMKSLPELSFGNDTSLCPGNILTLQVPEGTVWEDGWPGTVREISTAGIYEASLTNDCGVAADRIEVKFGNNISLELGADTTICEGDMISYDVSQSFPATYQWNTGGTESEIVIDRPGTYSVTVTSECDTRTEQVMVSVLNPPDVTFGADTILCSDRGEILRLDAYTEEASYQWQDGSNLDFYDVSQPGIYSVVVGNLCGMDMDEIKVEMEICDCSVYFPTAFTPNGDGVNENFGMIYSCDLGSYYMMIYNRWGKLVFKTENPDHQWDGTCKGGPCPEGVYAWKIRYQRKNQPIIEKGGTVTLIR